MNVCTFVGIITSDIQCSSDFKNKPFASFNIAVKKGNMKDQNLKDYNEFFTISAFGNIARGIKARCRKGDNIAVCCYAHNEKYYDTRGNVVNQVKFIVQYCDFLNNRNPGEEKEENYNDYFEEEII